MWGTTSLALGPCVPPTCSNLVHSMGWRRKPGWRGGKGMASVWGHATLSRMPYPHRGGISAGRRGTRLEERGVGVRSLHANRGQGGERSGQPRGAWQATWAPAASARWQRGQCGAPPRPSRMGRDFRKSFAWVAGEPEVRALLLGPEEGRAGAGPPGLSERQTRLPADAAAAWGPLGPSAWVSASRVAGSLWLRGGGWKGLRLVIVRGPRPPLPHSLGPLPPADPWGTARAPFARARRWFPGPSGGGLAPLKPIPRTQPSNLWTRVGRRLHPAFPRGAHRLPCPPPGGGLLAPQLPWASGSPLSAPFGATLLPLSPTLPLWPSPPIPWPERAFQREPEPVNALGFGLSTFSSP